MEFGLNTYLNVDSLSISFEEAGHAASLADGLVIPGIIPVLKQLGLNMDFNKEQAAALGVTQVSCLDIIALWEEGLSVMGEDTFWTGWWLSNDQLLCVGLDLCNIEFFGPIEFYGLAVIIRLRFNGPECGNAQLSPWTSVSLASE
ncbi:uncharacterized protein BT62DRAFT_923862 [Guyanagaster necrorhizus]|uniref:Uncharacterized protein n=1 Tax=Guyanagaster necrorhizus TaxID=856835 RepID=A0A9P7VHW0_9AGAR|nr:uncharacterized protein BT62DRAFT_923862 [Guyanagaster necrorhizus MCA 3950]KAG7440670.1 hypothetical protein BT62DRAFT_923862 [Guyanagaster necrorhizus MCA 3950]